MFSQNRQIFIVPETIKTLQIIFSTMHLVPVIVKPGFAAKYPSAFLTTVLTIRIVHLFMLHQETFGGKTLTTSIAVMLLVMESRRWSYR